MEDRFDEVLVTGVPDGRVPMGATVAPPWPALDPPGSSCREGEPPGEEVLVRLAFWPMALSKTVPRLVGFDWGLVVLLGRDPISWAMIWPTSASGLRPMS